MTAHNADKTFGMMGAFLDEGLDAEIFKKAQCSWELQKVSHFNRITCFINLSESDALNHGVSEHVMGISAT